MDFGSALLALLIGLIVKGAVMVLGGWLLVRLYQTTYSAHPRRLWLLLPEEDRPEIRVLWWSLCLFCASELTCGIEMYVLFGSNAILSGFHSLASGCAMALFAMGMWLHLDKRVIRYTRPRCALKPICGTCTVGVPDGCKLNVMAVLVCVFVCLSAVLPWFAPTARMNADVLKHALPFESWNAWYDATVVPFLMANSPNYEPNGVAYFLPVSMLTIEFRLIPVAAFILAGVAFWHVRARRESRGLALLALAVGGLCYTYFELALYAATGDVLIGSLGHELGEFWFLVIVVEFLRRSFPVPVA